MSCVTCQLSHVTRHLSTVSCKKKRIFSSFILKKIGQSGGSGRWRVCYQRGLPRLVFFKLLVFFCSCLVSIKIAYNRNHNNSYHMSLFSNKLLDKDMKCWTNQIIFLSKKPVKKLNQPVKTCGKRPTIGPLVNV